MVALSQFWCPTLSCADSGVVGASGWGGARGVLQSGLGARAAPAPIDATRVAAGSYAAVLGSSRSVFKSSFKERIAANQVLSERAGGFGDDAVGGQSQPAPGPGDSGMAGAAHRPAVIQSHAAPSPSVPMLAVGATEAAATAPGSGGSEWRVPGLGLRPVASPAEPDPPVAEQAARAQQAAHAGMAAAMQQPKASRERKVDTDFPNLSNIHPH